MRGVVRTHSRNTPRPPRGLAAARPTAAQRAHTCRLLPRSPLFPAPSSPSIYLDHGKAASGGRAGYALGPILLAPSSKVVAIDNGQAFPSGPSGIQQPPSTSVPFAGKGLLPETRARIEGMDLAELATALRRRGLDDEAVRHTLYRATLLHEQPEILAVPRELTVAGRRYEFGKMPGPHQTGFLFEPTVGAQQRITAAGRALLSETKAAKAA